MIIEPDQYYYEAGRYVWSPERRDAAWERAYRTLEEALRSGRVRKVVVLMGIPGSGKSTWARAHDGDDVVIFDGFFAYKDRQARVLEIARAAGVPVEAVWMQADWDTALARNARRPPDRRVPDETMKEMRRLLEENPPTVEEGFAAVRKETVGG
jgi:predicted kinase